jgi:hypothetical protein
MRVARMESQLATTVNLLSCILLREPFRVFCLRWPGLSFIKLVRETLSKTAMLPGLTYFYCNCVSQGGNVLLGCESEKRSRTWRLFGRPLLEKHEKWRTPSCFV